MSHPRTRKLPSKQLPNLAIMFYNKLPADIMTLEKRPFKMEMKKHLARNPCYSYSAVSISLEDFCTIWLYGIKDIFI